MLKLSPTCPHSLMSIHTHGHHASMSAESYISYCDGQHRTLVQFVLMLGVNHSLAKARPTMRCIRLVLHCVNPLICNQGCNIAWTHYSLTWGVCTPGRGKMGIRNIYTGFSKYIYIDNTRTLHYVARAPLVARSQSMIHRSR